MFISSFVKGKAESHKIVGGLNKIMYVRCLAQRLGIGGPWQRALNHQGVPWKLKLDVGKMALGENEQCEKENKNRMFKEPAASKPRELGSGKPRKEKGAIDQIPQGFMRWSGAFGLSIMRLLVVVEQFQWSWK